MNSLNDGNSILRLMPYTANDMVKVFVIHSTYLITCCITLRGPWIKLIITLRKTTLQDPEFKYPVTVRWGRGADTMEYWDQMSIASIELFGLPGDRFITNISAEHMTWIFRSDQDALLFKLKFSEVTC